MKEGILQTIVGVLTRPTSTIGSICQQRPIGRAIVVYLVIYLVSAIVTIGAEFPEGAGLPDFGPFLIPGVLVGIPIISLLGLVVFTAICHGVASVLGGKGSYWGLFSGFAFANLPIIFSAPLAAISLPFGIAGTMFYSLGSIGLSLWAMVLYVLAIRENYLVSTGRAILTLLLPLVLLAILGILIAILVVGMIGGLL